MDKDLEEQFNSLTSKDDNLRFDALNSILKTTNDKVSWIYEVWDNLVHQLEDENSYQRSIAIMVLCNLAKSDNENRMSSVIDRLLEHTRDEKFITSRQCIQNVWKVAAANPGSKQKIVTHLEEQYVNCSGDKHYNLIRQDIIVTLKNISDSEKGAALFEKIQKLLLLETELKYRKKYEQVLKSE